MVLSGDLVAVGNDVAEVTSCGVVEDAAAGDQADGGVGYGPVNRFSREPGLDIEPHCRDDELRDRAVRPFDEDLVAWPQQLKPEEDPLAGDRIDMAGDHRRSDRPWPRAP